MIKISTVSSSTRKNIKKIIILNSDLRLRRSIPSSTELCENNADLKRKNSTSVDSLNNGNTTRKKPRFDPEQKLISNFHKHVSEGPIYVCKCCSQTFFKHFVRKSNLLPCNETVKICLGNVIE